MSTEALETANTQALERRDALSQGPSWALARLSDSEFGQVMEMAQKGRSRLLQVMRSMMTEDVHFGQIPGAGTRKVLLKPGSEVLAQMFRLVCEPATTILYGDGVSSPHFTVNAVCRVHLDSLDGPVVAVGQAAGNSWEKKWRYRQADRICPSCGKPAIIEGKPEFGGGWVCFKKKGGCGQKWPIEDQSIAGQQTGQIENPDAYDLLNTVVKITNKRAKVDGIVAATNSSDLFTQDLEEGGILGTEPPLKPGEVRKGHPASEAAVVDSGVPPPEPGDYFEPGPFVPDEMKDELSTFRRRMEMCITRLVLPGFANTPQGRKKYLGMALGKTGAWKNEEVTLEELKAVNARLGELIELADKHGVASAGASLPTPERSGAESTAARTPAAQENGAASGNPEVAYGSISGGSASAGAAPDSRKPTKIEADAIRRTWHGLIAQGAAQDISFGPIHLSVCKGTDATASGYRTVLLENLLHMDIADKDDLMIADWQSAIAALAARVKMQVVG